MQIIAARRDGRQMKRKSLQSHRRRTSSFTWARAPGALGRQRFFCTTVWFIINFQKSREVHFGNKECRSAGAMAPARLSLHYTARIAETRFPLAHQSPYLAPKNCCLLFSRPVLKLETSLLLTQFFMRVSIQVGGTWAPNGEENLSAPLSPHFSSAARALEIKFELVDAPVPSEMLTRSLLLYSSINLRLSTIR